MQVVRAEVFVVNNWSPEQQAIINHPGSCLVWAGAGCGKSTTIRGKIQALKVPKEMVRVVTFTNKSRDDLRENIRKNYPAFPEGNILTIHQFFAQELRLAGLRGDLYGITGRDLQFEIWEETRKGIELRKFLQRFSGDFPDNVDIVTLVQFCWRNLDGNEIIQDEIGAKKYLEKIWYESRDNVAKVFTEISSLGIGEEIPRKPRGLEIPGWEEFRKFSRDVKDLWESDHGELVGFLNQLKKPWEEWKRSRNAMDFEDLEMWALHFNRPDLFEWLLIDEFQDTNFRQWDGLKSRARNFLLVGDPGQSIYGFRGADIEVFHQISKTFPVFYLTTNRRSHQEILDFSRKVLPWQQDLKAQSHDPESVHVHRESDVMEKMFTLSRDLYLQGEKNVAILAPSLKSIAELAFRFREEGIPVVVGAQDALEHPLVRRLVERWMSPEFQGLSWDESIQGLEHYLQDSVIASIMPMLVRIHQLGEPDIWKLAWWKMQGIQAGTDELPDDCIKILTVHSAKGLEFRHVISGRWFAETGSDTSRLSEGKFGLGISDPEHGPTAIRLANRIHDRKKREEERLRVFYVAVTRAKHRFHLVIGDDEAEDELALQLTGGEVNPEPGQKRAPRALLRERLEPKLTLEEPEHIPRKKSEIKTVNLTGLLSQTFCPIWDFEKYPPFWTAGSGKTGTELHAQWEWETPQWLKVKLGLSENTVTEAALEWVVPDRYIIEGRADGVDFDRHIVLDYKTFNPSPFYQRYYSLQVAWYGLMLEKFEGHAFRGYLVWPGENVQLAEDVSKELIFSHGIEKTLSPERIRHCEVCPQNRNCSQSLA